MKVINASAAAELIQSGDCITLGGFGHCGSPEALLDALEARYLAEGAPRRLSLLFASGAGDRLDKGVNKLAHPGLLSRVVGGFWSLAPRLGELVKANLIEAYNWPQGVVSQIYRTVAAGRPALVTTVGLGTFVDPQQSGAGLNESSRHLPVERVELCGQTVLAYPAIPIHVALLRGSYCDARGNVSMEEEANLQDMLAQAQAVKNSGGLVIVQVKDVLPYGAIAPERVRIPGLLVDYAVVAEDRQHWQTYGEFFNPAYAGAARRPVVPTQRLRDQGLSAKRVVARRAALELLSRAGSRDAATPLVVNLGIGTPEWIAQEVERYGLQSSSHFTLTVESGAVGGVPAGGQSFGATLYPDALLAQADLFDFYDGGGIDLAFLGFGQIDARGRINVASLGGRVNGVGGFINISQSARGLCFCGSFSTGGLRIEIEDGELRIDKEGRCARFVEAVDRICFDAQGVGRSREALVITERAVFQLSGAGLELVELAPGVDIGRDLRPHIPFELRVSPALKPMPEQVFRDVGLMVPFES